MKKILEKIRKVILWTPDIRLVAIVAVTAFLLLLVPLLRIAIYTVPWYDDYGYGNSVKNFLSLEYSLSSALQGAIYCVRTQWWAWQGTFSSIFFMATAPFVWNESYYFLGSLFLIIILPLSVFVLAGVLLRSVLKADMSYTLILQATVAAAVVVFIHSDRAGFYWYNSGVHYVGMHAFLLLTAAAWIKILAGTGRIRTVLLLVWTLFGAVLGGGANFVTALQGLVLLMSLAALGVLLRKRRTFLLLPSMAVYLYAFYINVSAPGNSKRQALFSGSGEGVMGAASAVLSSFWEALRYLWRFTGLRTWAVVLLLLPIIWQMLKKTEFRFKYPALILLWSFCFYATGFTPSLYAMGHAGLGRTLNSVKITWQLLLFLNEVYWLGWLRQKTREKGRLADLARKFRRRDKIREGVPVCFYLLMGMLMFGIFAADPYQAAHYSTFCAYWYVHTGEADAFHKEYLARVETIINGGSVVEVTPYHFKPAPICVDDLSADPSNEANQFMASWYGKEAIICKSADTE